jgi:hypothetical protein
VGQIRLAKSLKSGTFQFKIDTLFVEALFIEVKGLARALVVLVRVLIANVLQPRWKL